MRRLFLMAALSLAACSSSSSGTKNADPTDGGGADGGSASGEGGTDGGGGKVSGTIMFQTSFRFDDGNIGGRAGADAKCVEAAKSAGLPGTYHAFIAVTGYDPFENMGPGPFVNVLGELLFATTPEPKTAVQGNLTDENGGESWHYIWTGTPESDQANCNGWTSNGGISTGSYGMNPGDPKKYAADFSAWFVSNSQQCTQPGAVYCIQQP